MIKVKKVSKTYISQDRAAESYAHCSHSQPVKLAFF